MTLNPASAFEDEKNFSGHRSGIYMNHKVSSASNGVVHIYNQINHQIGAYGLIHYKKDDSNARAAKGMIENAIISNIDENGQAKSDWKTFLNATLKNVENTMKQGAYRRYGETADMATILVVVDGKIATQAKIFPKTPQRSASFKKWIANIGTSKSTSGDIAEFTSADGLLVMGTDFVWNKGEDKMVDKILQNPRSMKDAATKITNWVKAANEENEMDKGAIIIELF